MHVSVMKSKKEKFRKLSHCFHSFLQASENGPLAEISHIDGKEWPIKTG